MLSCMIQAPSEAHSCRTRSCGAWCVPDDSKQPIYLTSAQWGRRQIQYLPATTAGGLTHKTLVLSAKLSVGHFIVSFNELSRYKLFLTHAYKLAAVAKMLYMPRLERSVDNTVMCGQSCCCGNSLFILFPILIRFIAWHSPCQLQLCHNEGLCSVRLTNSLLTNDPLYLLGRWPNWSSYSPTAPLLSGCNTVNMWVTVLYFWLWIRGGTAVPLDSCSATL